MERGARSFNPGVIFKNFAASGLFTGRISRAVDRRIGIQHSSRIGQGCAGIERNGDTKSLSYFLAGRPSIDDAVGVHADAGRSAW